MLGSVEAPVRSLWGEHDAWLDTMLGERSSEEMPTATFEKIPGPVTSLWRTHPKPSRWSSTGSSEGSRRSPRVENG